VSYGLEPAMRRDILAAVVLMPNHG
jgi:hypothetical protein